MADGAIVGAPGIRVGDLGGEEFLEAAGGGFALDKEDRWGPGAEPFDSLPWTSGCRTSNRAPRCRRLGEPRKGQPWA